MTAKRPNQTLPFRLHLSNTVNLDLPSVAGKVLPARQPSLFQSHAGERSRVYCLKIKIIEFDIHSLKYKTEC